MSCWSVNSFDFALEKLFPRKIERINRPTRQKFSHDILGIDAYAQARECTRTDTYGDIKETQTCARAHSQTQSLSPSPSPFPSLFTSVSVCLSVSISLSLYVCLRMLLSVCVPLRVSISLSVSVPLPYSLFLSPFLSCKLIPSMKSLRIKYEPIMVLRQRLEVKQEQSQSDKLFMSRT